jgi:hypothetical protein
MNTGKQYPIFTKSMVGVMTILALGTTIFIRGSKDKIEFERIAGKITYLEKTYEELPNRHHGKYRYIEMDAYPKVFELFVGKEFGDFKPHYERIDDLRVGDTIEVYFDEDAKEPDRRLNRLMQFMDKDSQPYYIRGRKDKTGGYFFIFTGILLGGFLIYLKMIGKVL